MMAASGAKVLTSVGVREGYGGAHRVHTEPLREDELEELERNSWKKNREGFETEGVTTSAYHSSISPFCLSRIRITP